MVQCTIGARWKIIILNEKVPIRSDNPSQVEQLRLNRLNCPNSSTLQVFNSELGFNTYPTRLSATKILIDQKVHFKYLHHIWYIIYVHVQANRKDNNL